MSREPVWHCRAGRRADGTAFCDCWSDDGQREHYEYENPEDGHPLDDPAIWTLIAGARFMFSMGLHAGVLARSKAGLEVSDLACEVAAERETVDRPGFLASLMTDAGLRPR